MYSASRASKSDTSRLLTAQALGHEEMHYMDTTELYNEDVQLVVKNGKIYYLPETE